MPLQLYKDIACEGEMLHCEDFCSSSVGSLRQFTHVCRYPGPCSGIQLPIAHDACEYKCLIPYGRNFWRGIYFGRLAVLRAIRQYFIRQIAAQCDVIIIAKSYQCVYTRPAARRASLIVGIEFTIKSCVREHHFSKEFCTPEVGEELACLSRRRRRSKRRVRGPVKTDGTKVVQTFCYEYHYS